MEDIMQAFERNLNDDQRLADWRESVAHPDSSAALTPPDAQEKRCTCGEYYVRCEGEGCDAHECAACKEWHDEPGHPGYGGCLCTRCLPHFTKLWPAFSYPENGLHVFASSHEAMEYMIENAEGECTTLWRGQWGIYPETQAHYCSLPLRHPLSIATKRGLLEDGHRAGNTAQAPDRSGQSPVT